MICGRRDQRGQPPAGQHFLVDFVEENALRTGGQQNPNSEPGMATGGAEELILAKIIKINERPSPVPVSYISTVLLSSREKR